MDLAHYKKIITTENEKLIAEISYYKKEDPYLDQNRSPETYDDSVTEIEGHDRITATKSELEISLKDAEAALERIEAGTFGNCLNCGQKISAERLEVMPTASFCTSCQEMKKRA